MKSRNWRRTVTSARHALTTIWSAEARTRRSRRRAYEAIRNSNVFDPEWYSTQFRDTASAKEDLLWDYVSGGWRETRNPHPLFDVGWYLGRYGHTFSNTTEPFSHYLTKGARLGFNPNRLFDSVWYLAEYPDVEQRRINPLVHYVLFGATEARNPHPLFDTTWYLAQNPELVRSDFNALNHYLQFGAAEGRSPHPLFDAKWYIEEYQLRGDDAADPLSHYLRRETQAVCKPHPLFDRTYLERRYQVVFSADCSALESFSRKKMDPNANPTGLFDSALYRYQVEVEQGRSLQELPIIDYLKRGYRDKNLLPNLLFDPKTYLDGAQLDGAGAALTHYRQFGDREGLITHPHFDAGFYNSTRTDQISNLTAIEHFFLMSPLQRGRTHQSMQRPLPQDVIEFVQEAVANPRGAARKALSASKLPIRDIPLAFFADEYQQFNRDLQHMRGFQELFQHYLDHGCQESRIIGRWQLYTDMPEVSVPILTAPIRTSSDKKIELAILMHIYYPELFEELAAYAQNFETFSQDIFINVVSSVWSPEFHAKIRKLCPDAFVLISNDSGRDIGGFTRLLSNVNFERYEFFAWMHTKKSPHIAPEQGELWRRALLSAFAGTKDIAAKTIQDMREDRSIGLVGSKKWRSTHLGKNAGQYRRMLQLFKIDQKNSSLEYLSGTMFLARNEVIRRLYAVFKDLKFESGGDDSIDFNIDGQIAHAAERVIGNVVRQLGYRTNWV